MQIRRLCFLGILVPLMVMASLAACVGQDQPRYGGTFVNMINPSEVITLDPLRSSITDAETGSVIMQVHRGLVVWTPELSVEPGLAESWDISEDGDGLHVPPPPGCKLPEWPGSDRAGLQVLL